MEAAEDKKKKKRNNKKKKNQKATADDASVTDNGQVSSSAAAAADTIPDAVQVSGDGQVPKPADVAETNGTERSLLAESENKHWLEKEAKLEEKIKQLEKEKDLQMHKEGVLQKEIVKLRSEKDSWLQKEVGLEDQISRLVDKNSTLDFEEASLQEKIKHLQSDRDAWNLKEDSFKEMIATQTDNIAKLQAQVLELEQSRDNLVQENQQLMGNLASLELQIKDRESVSSSRSSIEGSKHASEREELNSQIEAACQLVEKLITENADLVEKVNELYVELERHSAKVGLPSTTTVLPGETAVTINSMSRSDEDMSPSGQKLYSTEVMPLKVGKHSNGNMDSQQAASLKSNGDLDIQHPESVPNSPISYASSESEIVQIPLDTSAVRDLELQSATKVENEAVPITDAPLIGAPFRLVSFVARYVSGTDLVNKS